MDLVDRRLREFPSLLSHSTKYSEIIKSVKMKSSTVTAEGALKVVNKVYRKKDLRAFNLL